MTNLVQNAIRHNERGGTATVRVHADGDEFAVIEVSNSGVVIAQEAADQLIDPFFRGKGRTNAASNRGRGLGLSIASTIINRHDGSLVIVPGESGGLKVRVTLPAANPVQHY